MSAVTIFLAGFSLQLGAPTTNPPARPIIVPPGATVTVDPAPAAATPVPKKRRVCRAGRFGCKKVITHPVKARHRR